MDIIERFKEKHGDRYDYSKVEYTKMHDKVEIICHKHGSFFQEPHSHLRGYGCPKCAIEQRSSKRRDTTESYIEKAKMVHGDRYDYSKVDYRSSQEKICVICRKHGEFYIKPNDHINNKRGCPLCYNEKRGVSQKLTKEEFIKKARLIHGDRYDYSKVEYINSRVKVCIVCPEHGEFWQEPTSHLSGRKCPSCAKIESASKRRMTTEEFVEKAKTVHGDRYDYSQSEYVGIYEPITIVCGVHGAFRQIASYHLSGNGCQQCAQEMTDSASERELYDFVRMAYDGVVMQNYRSILNDNKELDIYLPSAKLAFEFDGLYWHNERNQPSKSYHLSKTEECLSKGIQLVHIFEDEWIYKKDIVKSRILNLLGKSDRIYARKCEIRNVSPSTARLFLNNNHIQGFCSSAYRYGLYYNGELVSLMTFGNKRKNLGSKSINGHYELLRFCNKLNTTVIGGASRLFKHFIKEVKPIEIVSYADRRWSNGNLYEKLGFTLTHKSQPSYFYVINDKRENRFKYRKDALVKEGYDSNKTEHEIMLERGIYRIYDCGCLVYDINFEKED